LPVLVELFRTETLSISLIAWLMAAAAAGPPPGAVLLPSPITISASLGQEHYEAALSAEVANLAPQSTFPSSGIYRRPSRAAPQAAEVQRMRASLTGRPPWWSNSEVRKLRQPPVFPAGLGPASPVIGRSPPAGAGHRPLTASRRRSPPAGAGYRRPTPANPVVPPESRIYHSFISEFDEKIANFMMRKIM